MELRLLRQAIALADHGSFSKAAVSLHLSQSALTRGIQALEQHVGVRLFERHHGGVEPTSAGALLLKRARSLLKQIGELEDEMGRSGPADERPVRIAAGPYAAPMVVVPAVSRAWQQECQPQVELEVTRWARAIRLVHQGRIDLAVAEDSELDAHGLEVTKLRTHRAHLVMRRGHPLEGEAVVGLEEAFRWPLAFVSGVPARLSSRFPRSDGRTPFTPAFRCEDLGLTKELLASSDLVALLPLCLIGGELEAGVLTAAPLREQWVETSFSIMRLNGQPAPSPVEELVGHLVEADRLAAERSEELAETLKRRKTRKGAARRRRRGGKN